MIGVAYVAADLGHHRAVAGVHLHLFLYRRGGTVRGFHHQLHHLPAADQPLKEIAETARKFGHGEYEVRVQGYENGRTRWASWPRPSTPWPTPLPKRGPPQQFVANISHELKTPMTTIAGFSDGILDGTIRRTRKGAPCRPSPPKPGGSPAWCGGCWICPPPVGGECHRQGAVRRVRGHAAGAGEPGEQDQCPPSGRGHPAPRRPRAGVGDPDAITQVCYNLLDNAIKFSAEGHHGPVHHRQGGQGPRSGTQSRRHHPPDELAMIFDRFHKSDKSRSVDREGVGLGLYIVKTILNSHKGEHFRHQPGRRDGVVHLP